MNEKILALAILIDRKIPWLRRVAICICSPVGSLRFRLAYRNACRRGYVQLHVGAGLYRLEGWLNTDILPLAPLYLDATRRFPIRDNSVSYIFNEHFIEHVPRQAATKFLEESFRVLRPGGILRTVTPDVEALATAYLEHSECVPLLNERNRQLGKKHSTYPVDILNKVFLDDRHVCLYDEQTLGQLLRSAGFQNITRCKVGESHHAGLSGIEQHDPSIEDDFTCVLEATKPPFEG